MRKVGTIIFLMAIAGTIAFFASTADKERISYFWDNLGQEKEEDITILVLGRVAEGQGGRWHAAPGLVDAIVIVNYRPNSDVINLVSLPRDLYGEFGGQNFKINEIYRRKKIEDFMHKLPEISGIEVENFLVVDVRLIETAVDSLGGIDVDIDSAVTDPVSGYRLDVGVHHLSGEDAMWLMRNRYSPEGDFFREKNQHVVIASIFDKFNILSSSEKTKFLLGMVPFLKSAETNFSIGEIVPKIGRIDKVTFNSVTLDFSTGLLVSSYVPVGKQPSASIPQDALVQAVEDSTGTLQDAFPQQSSVQTVQATTTGIRAYVLIPKEGANNYTKIREFIQNRLL